MVALDKAARHGRAHPYKDRTAIRTALTVSILASAALLGGCGTVPVPLDGIVTGSVSPKLIARRGEAVPEGVASEDWAVARLALYEALSDKADKADSGAPSVPWENLASATRGTVTPIGEGVARDGTSCREFLMSFVKETGENWLQGEACRVGQRGWKVEQARLLQKA